MTAASLALLVVTAIALALSSAGGDRSARAGARADEAEPARLAALTVRIAPAVARRTERIRELEFRDEPAPEVVPSAFLTRLERRQLERSGGLRGIAVDEAETRIVGLLGEDEQLDAAAASTGELAAAAYDPRSDRLYVLSDAVAATRPLVEFVLAHELTHALEDQRFGLADVNQFDTDDAALAELALDEGSATSAMVAYARRYLDATDLIAALDTLDTGTGDVPAFVVEQLEWAYLGGMRFVDRLRALAGGWTLVDYAHSSRPPASTEQVLHARRYVEDERPLAVAIESRALRGRGWRLADRGDLGEYTTRQLLAVGVADPIAEDAAAGWGGDRYELWRRSTPPGSCQAPCRADLALVLRWRWDSPRDVRRFAAAASDYVAEGLEGAAAGAAIWSVEDGAVALASDRSSATLVFAPSAGLARAVASRNTSGLGGSAP